MIKKATLAAILLNLAPMGSAGNYCKSQLMTALTAFFPKMRFGKNSGRVPCARELLRPITNY
jgi:hypothetical protein